jgi:peptidoglycan DL-endopeptidase CwlO
VNFSSRIGAIEARIAEIHDRFGFNPPGQRSPQGTAGFAQVLAGALSSDRTAMYPASLRDDTPESDGARIVAEAERYLGVPYVFGSSNPEVGLDCSGLLLRVFDAFGVKLPHLADSQAKRGTPVASLAEARPGDLLAFDLTDDPSRPYIDHIGIYIGNGRMIHAPRTGRNVEYTTVATTGRSAPVAIRRIELPGAAVPGDGGSGYSRVTGLRPGSLAVPPAAALFGPDADQTPVGEEVPFATQFNTVGARYGIAPRLLAALAYTESGFRPDAVSSAGAVGLMQFMPATAAEWGVDPRDPVSAVDGAGRFLSALFRQTGTVETALAAYNAGLGAVRRHGGVPPFSETRAHGRRILQILGRSQ